MIMHLFSIMQEMKIYIQFYLKSKCKYNKVNVYVFENVRIIQFYCPKLSQLFNVECIIIVILKLIIPSLLRDKKWSEISDTWRLIWRLLFLCNSNIYKKIIEISNNDTLLHIYYGTILTKNLNTYINYYSKR